MEPIRTTLGYGQVNTILMALVVVDLLPAPGERRRFPQGVLTGLAASIKLTPALFVVFDFLIGKRRRRSGRSSASRSSPRSARSSCPETLGLLRTGWPAATPGRRRRSTSGTSRCSACSSGSAAVARHRPGRDLRCAGIVALIGAIVAAYWWRGPEGVRRRDRRDVHLPGLAAVVDPPLCLGAAAGDGGDGRPAAALGPDLGGAWVIWVCVCLPLAVLPYGGGRERQFDVLQQLIANLGPIVGVILFVGLAWQLVATPRLQPAKATAG